MASQVTEIDGHRRERSMSIEDAEMFQNPHPYNDVSSMFAAGASSFSTPATSTGIGLLVHPPCRCTGWGPIFHLPDDRFHRVKGGALSYLSKDPLSDAPRALYQIWFRFDSRPRRMVHVLLATPTRHRRDITMVLYIDPQYVVQIMYTRYLYFFFS